MRKLWLLPCLTVLLTAADISGKWGGTVDVEDPTDGSTISTEVRAEFQQQADKISGKIGRQGEQESESIKDAKLEGTRLTFEVSSTEMSGVFKFALTLEGDGLEGEMSGTMEGNPITGKVHLKRKPAAL